MSQSENQGGPSTLKWSPAYVDQSGWIGRTLNRDCTKLFGPCTCGAWHTDKELHAMPYVEDPPAAPTSQQEEFTREQLFALHLDLTTKALQLMRKKNADYSTTGPFMNFTACEAYGITAEDGIITRMSDKLSRLASVIRKGAEVSESEDDTIIDVINYAVCLAGLRRSRAKESK